MATQVKILETFRDAIQGLDYIVPTEHKVKALRLLYELGFDYVDAGSFVSSKYIPQFADMGAVLKGTGHPPDGTSLFILAGSVDGAEMACRHDQVEVIGFPFSTSETFLRKNIHAGFHEAWSRLESIKATCDAHGRRLMVYLAMAFGNPYGDPVSKAVVMEWAGRLSALGVSSIHLSDIIGVATPPQVAGYYRDLHRAFPELELGIHLHIKDEGWKNLLASAAGNGCTLFDGVIGGLGGCPMTGYEMLRNLPTLAILEFALEQGLQVRVDRERLAVAREKILELILP